MLRFHLVYFEFSHGYWHGNCIAFEEENPEKTLQIEFIYRDRCSIKKIKPAYHDRDRLTRAFHSYFQTALNPFVTERESFPIPVKFHTFEYLPHRSNQHKIIIRFTLKEVKELFTLTLTSKKQRWHYHISSATKPLSDYKTCLSWEDHVMKCSLENLRWIKDIRLLFVSAPVVYKYKRDG
ncbi:hypothetical protein IMZ31_21565 (plasmid) [Pontibacillus sp. ALD_SL1]|uniref:hypothetical protein n=1 Tax=Pontibacillus sp. ALD_SL1 TaxID=2777185 RepID=UPI001A978401|nr:hypothetical protein [Pontibacillus sp. ALD_SL1]QST02041.1 hypothetical protein IMZ31_21565 [Pontibacillus sp. ALD_SL1]